VPEAIELATGAFDGVITGRNPGLVLSGAPIPFKVRVGTVTAGRCYTIAINGQLRETR